MPSPDRVSLNLGDWWERRVFAPWRRKAWAGVLPGRLLEVGVGSGPNMAYYPAGASVTAVDRNRRRIDEARRRASALGLNVDLRVMSAEELDFPDGYFDGAVSTLVFCAVPDPVRGLRELARVVKPGGEIRLVEHMRVDRPIVGRLMDWLDPVMVRIGDEHLNRRTMDNIALAGLPVVSVENLVAGGLVRYVVARSPGPLPAPGSER